MGESKGIPLPEPDLEPSICYDYGDFGIILFNIQNILTEISNRIINLFSF